MGRSDLFEMQEHMCIVTTCSGLLKACVATGLAVRLLHRERNLELGVRRTIGVVSRQQQQQQLQLVPAAEVKGFHRLSVLTCDSSVSCTSSIAGSPSSGRLGPFPTAMSLSLKGGALSIIQ